MPIAAIETPGVRPPFDDASVQLSVGRGSYKRAVTIQEGERTTPIVREARLGPEGRDALVDLTLRSLVLAATAKSAEPETRQAEKQDAAADTSDDAGADTPASVAPPPDTPAPPAAADTAAAAPLPAAFSPRAEASSSLLGSAPSERGRRVDTIA